LHGHLRPGVADHDVHHQLAQCGHVTRPAPVSHVNEAAAELGGRTQLAGAQEGDQVVQFLQVVLDRRGRQQQQELARNLGHQAPGGRIPMAQVMGLVHDQEVKGSAFEHLPVSRHPRHAQRGDHQVPPAPGLVAQ